MKAFRIISNGFTLEKCKLHYCCVYCDKCMYVILSKSHASSISD